MDSNQNLLVAGRGFSQFSQLKHIPRPISGEHDSSHGLFHPPYPGTRPAAVLQDTPAWTIRLSRLPAGLPSDAFACMWLLSVVSMPSCLPPSCPRTRPKEARSPASATGLRQAVLGFSERWGASHPWVACSARGSLQGHDDPGGIPVKGGVHACLPRSVSAALYALCREYHRGCAEDRFLAHGPIRHRSAPCANKVRTKTPSLGVADVYAPSSSYDLSGARLSAIPNTERSRFPVCWASSHEKAFRGLS